MGFREIGFGVWEIGFRVVLGKTCCWVKLYSAVFLRVEGPGRVGKQGGEGLGLGLRG